MNHYLTPSKPTTKKMTKTQTQDKPSDWICVVCNNLNFSFRKKCNRCKNQTRIQNQNHLATAYSEYYYQNQNYLSVAKPALGDATNIYTPQPQQSKYPKQNMAITVFNDKQTNSSIKVLPFQNSYNILDSECWESLNVEQKQNEQPKQKREDEEMSVCEFTDMQLEFLVSQVLDQNL